MHCPECGFVNTEGANYCQKCGAYLARTEGGDEGEESPTTMTYKVDETGEYVGELLDVVAGDQRIALRMLVAQAADQLGAQDVDLAVEDPPAVRHLLLLVSELLDEVLELLVGERTQIGEGVHVKRRPLLGGRDGSASIAVIKLR